MVPSTFQYKDFSQSVDQTESKVQKEKKESLALDTNVFQNRKAIYKIIQLINYTKMFRLANLKFGKKNDILGRKTDAFYVLKSWKF